MGEKIIDQTGPLAIGCDHIGYALKEEIKVHLASLGIECTDFGAHSTERSHYPLFAEQVAQAVVAGRARAGILVCGTGVGMAIAANKVPGIRAVVCSETYSAAMSRRHNNTNILAFGSLVVGAGLARQLVDAWLAAEYEGGRHAGRVEMIAALEAARQPPGTKEPR